MMVAAHWVSQFTVVAGLALKVAPCSFTLPRVFARVQFACLWRVVVDIEGGELQGDSVNWITGE